MRTHVVVDGECLSSLAERYGFRSWRTIYEHADNSSLRAKRANPNLLAPGDVVAIPDREERAEDAATGQRHTFVTRRPACTIELRFLAHDGSVLARRPVRLVIDGGEEQLQTNGEGRVSVSIRRDAAEGVATVDGHTFPFGLGMLRPVEPTAAEADAPTEARSGAASQAQSGTPESTGRADATTAAAVRTYQTERKLSTTGTLDAATRAAILGEHTC